MKKPTLQSLVPAWLALVLMAAALPARAEILIPRGSTWKYHNLNVDLGSTWRGIGYNDTAWAQGVGPLGGGTDTHLVTQIGIGPADPRFPTIYFRRSFTIANAGAYSGLTLRVLRDDAAIVYLNGVEVQSVNVTTPIAFTAYSGTDAGDAIAEATYFEFGIPAAGLINGVNVIAVEGKQATSNSSDFGFDLELEGNADTTAPTVGTINPPQGANVLSLTFINTIFSESVTNVDAGDLLINGTPATNLVVNNPNDYTFYFPQPSTGTVNVAFAPGHGIIDRSPLANPFAGANWTYNLDTNASTRPNVVISEFLADNNNGIRDDDGQRNDWVELYNVGPLDANLDGWFLTDDAANLTKWRIPAVALGNNGYVLIFASSKNRANLNAPLHTNFKLQKEAGGFLALVDAQTNVISSFTNYPVQTPDISYGRDRVDPNLVGYFSPPTPAAQNSTGGSGLMGPPVVALVSGVYTNASLTLTIVNTNSGGTIRYTTDGTLPSATSTVYAAPLTLSANSTIKARVFPPAGSTLLPSAVVARNFIFLDSTAANFTSRLPTLIISTEGRAIPANVPPGSPRVNGSFVVIDTEQGRSSIRGQSEVHELAQFEIFGQTSAGFPKLPIRVEIQDAVGNDLDTEVLGMPADSDWRLRNPYNDKTLMNDFLGYEIWEKMGHYSVRRRLVEVFVDTGGARTVYPGDYYGVMMLCETIKANDDRVDIPALSPYATNEPAISGGYIFKRDKDSVGDIQFTSPGGPGFAGIPLKLHEPNVNQLRNPGFQGVTTVFPGPGYTAAGTNQLNYLRNYLGRMERAMYTNTWLAQTGTNHYSHYLDTERFADQMLHVEFTKQIDGYRLSDYFTKDRNGKVGPGPVWDWNLSFGNADYLQGGRTNGWYYELAGEQDHPWARRLITGSASGTTSTGDPDFVQLVADRWAMFRTNVLNGTNMNRQIDELSSLLSEAAARDLFGKYRANLIGRYTWPNPDGSVATAGSIGAADSRDVDFVRPTNYLGPIEMVAPSTASGSIIGQMKKWVLGRYLWMDSQFTGVPTLSASDSMVTNGYSVTVTPPPGATLYYTVNGTDPRAPGGAVAPGAVTVGGPATITVTGNMRVVARAKMAGAWKSTWSGPAASTFFTVTPSLRITEIMYHPAPPPVGSTNSAEDFEYIEVKNIGSIPLNVNQFSLAGGVQFQFPNVVLAAGQSAVIVANEAAFQSRYGSNILVLGTFTGGLNNAGDHLALLGSLQEPILDFSFADNWSPTTDGLGFSLVTIDENAATGAWNLPSNWRASSAIGGSPSGNDPAAPSRPAVVVNEVLANGDAAAGDAVELHNTTATPVDISGWFLSDDFETPRKYVVPTGTVVPAGGFIVFYETNSFGGTNAWNSNGATSFGLGAKGDDIYLFSADGLNLTGYAHGFDFGASASNATFGRYVISSGSDHFVAQQSATLNATNSGPLVGPVIVSEIHYNPPPLGVNGVAYNNVNDEFIEVHNISSNAVNLFDAAYPTNTWRLRDAVEYDFPSGVTLPAGGYLLLVGFDPVADPAALASFRNNNFVPLNIPVYGPWSGRLDNDSARVELSRPGLPDTNSVPYILVERVGYQDGAPWPTAADSFGFTLQRIVASSYGNDATNWAAAAPSPAAGFVAGGTAPTITSQPGNRLNIFGTDVAVSATATGTDPIRYQWRFNGYNLPGANSSSLVLSNFQPSEIGVYSVFVYNNGGYVVGTNFTLSGRVGLEITTQPVDRVSQTNAATTFTVGAVGSGTLRYQWQKDGTNLVAGTNATLSIASVQLANEGTYTVRVTDDYTNILSDAVTLTVIFRPAIILQPIAQSVVEGGTVSFSIAGTGTLPLNFRWRSNGVTFVPAGGPVLPSTVYFNNGMFVIGTNSSTLILTNVGTNYNGARFSVALTNIAGSAPLSTSVLLTVLADADRDGLPDIWETGRPGFNSNDSTDGGRDDDSDTMSNAEEYFAGTDPFDGSSYLKVNIADTGAATLSFNAVSNRTYSVLYTDGLNPAIWEKLSDVLARATNRTESLTDPAAPANRFYRLVVPVQP